MDDTRGPVVYGEVARFGHQSVPTYSAARVVVSRARQPPPVTTPELAPWGHRVAAHLVDMTPHLVAGAVSAVGYGLVLAGVVQGRQPRLGEAPSTVLLVGGLLWAVALGWQLRTRWLDGGRSGQSYGKRLLGLRLVSAQNGQPVGPGNAFLRDVVHLLDAVAGLGFLWPLWDERRQTFADKAVRTVVVTTTPASRPG